MPSKNILITGNSRGLGQCLSLLFESKGFRVFGLHRDIVDLADTPSVKNYTNYLSQFHFDTIIINAATVGIEIDDNYHDIWSSSCEELFKINFLNQIRMLHTLIPKIEKNIIFITSRIGSFNRYKNQLTYEFPFRKLIYASTKISLNHISSYYAKTNPKLKVYSIAPGSLNNEFEGKYTKKKNRITIRESAESIYEIISNSTQPSGSFLNYDGFEHPL
tara:strand:- start:2635 stop:3288 length:654 start_codon:yes stop_codon:yes gene_type:complete